MPFFPRKNLETIDNTAAASGFVKKNIFLNPIAHPACIHLKFTSWFSVPESKLPSESFPLCKPVAMWHHQLLFISIFHIPVSAINFFLPLSRSASSSRVLFTPRRWLSHVEDRKQIFFVDDRAPVVCCGSYLLPSFCWLTFSFEAFFISIDMKVILPCARKPRMNLDDLSCVPGRRRMQAAC